MSSTWPVTLTALGATVIVAPLMGFVAISKLALAAGAAINNVTIAMLIARMIFIVRPFSATLIRVNLPTSLDLVSTPSGDK